jgi:hypothetical protein
MLFEVFYLRLDPFPSSKASDWERVRRCIIKKAKDKYRGGSLNNPIALKKVGRETVTTGYVFSQGGSNLVSTYRFQNSDDLLQSLLY